MISSKGGGHTGARHAAARMGRSARCARAASTAFIVERMVWLHACATPGGNTLDPELNSATNILQLITGRCAAGRQLWPSPAQM